MIRLLRVELARLLARRAVVVTALIGVAGTVLLGLAAYSTSQPLSEGEAQQAEEQYAIALQDWEENGEQYVEDCLQQQEQEAELTGEDVDFACDEQEPQREWFFPQPPSFQDYLTINLLLPLGMLGLLVLTLGISAVAAEFSTGTMATWLTFVPRRGQVLASRLLALGVVGLAYAAVWWAVMLLLTWAAFRINGEDPGLPATVLQQVPRAAALGALVAVVGGALGFLLRHSAAALGVAIGLLIVVDGVVLGALVPGGGRWSVLTNAQAWVGGGAPYYEQTCTTDSSGTVCELIERTVTTTQGGLVLLGIGVVAVVLAALTFSRREVR